MNEERENDDDAFVERLRDVLVRCDSLFDVASFLVANEGGTLYIHPPFRGSTMRFTNDLRERNKTRHRGMANLTTK